MGASQELQGDIDRVLKEVQKGVYDFDRIHNKLYKADDTKKKEKYKANLKEVVKKLKRYRDQLNTWIQSSEIKKVSSSDEKQALVDAVKLIECEMERFKVGEYETWTSTPSAGHLHEILQDEARKRVLIWKLMARNRPPDQLSSLPDEILQKILSHLNTKAAAQTSVLKKRWKHVWKGVAVIRLSMPSDLKIVDAVISRCLTNHTLSEIHVRLRNGEEDYLDRVMVYVASRGIEHIELVCIGYYNSRRSLKQVFRSLGKCSATVQFIRLAGLCLGSAAVRQLSGMQQLQTLELSDCHLGRSLSGGDDGFPRLETLRLDSCYPLSGGDGLKIGLRLILRLEVNRSPFSLEITGPNLQYLSVDGIDKCNSELPSLEVGKGSLRSSYKTQTRTQKQRQARNGLSVLKNAQSVLLDGSGSGLLYEDLWEVAKQDNSLFTRLKSLTLRLDRDTQFPVGATKDWSKYFFSGSPFTMTAEMVNYKPSGLVAFRVREEMTTEEERISEEMNPEETERKAEDWRKYFWIQILDDPSLE